MAIHGRYHPGAFILLFIWRGAFCQRKIRQFQRHQHPAKRPSSAHPFGTDTVGRDILARTIYGGQISLMIGLTAVIIEILAGILIGALAGYYGGWLDSATDALHRSGFEYPTDLSAAGDGKILRRQGRQYHLLGRTFSGSVVVIIVIIGVTSWPYLARIVRAEFLSIKENDFILAARATGSSTHSIILRHILPNSHGARSSYRRPWGWPTPSFPKPISVSGAGRAAADRHLGKHAGRSL